MGFFCSDVPPAPVFIGLNTLLLSASSTATPDVIALGATKRNDGIVYVTGSPSQGAFAVATDNLGHRDTITVAINTGARRCRSPWRSARPIPRPGPCLQTPSASSPTTIISNATPTFAVFVSASNPVPFNPANNRIFVTFTEVPTRCVARPGGDAVEV